MYTNADCLTNKVTDLSILLQTFSHKPSVIVVTEVNSKSSSDTISSQFFINGYSYYQVNIGVQHTRGIIIYVLNGLRHRQIFVDIIYAEYLLIEICLSDGSTLTLGAFYRSPHSDSLNNSKLFEAMSLICNKIKGNLILLGDFNITNINWDRCCTIGNSGDQSLQSKLVDCVRKNNLTQHVKHPTRFRGMQNPNILDLVFTNSDFIDDIEMLSPLGKSDHVVMGILCNFNLLFNNSKKKFNFDKGDYCGFNSFIKDRLEYDDIPLTGHNDVSTFWNTLRGLLLEGTCKYVPEYNCQTNNKWTIPLPKDILDLIKQKHRSFKHLRKSRNQATLSEYKKLNNLVRKRTREHKAQLHRNIAVSCKSNPKKFWQYVNQRTKPLNQIGDLKVTDNNGTSTIVNEDTDKANAFSEYFLKVFNSEPEINVPSIRGPLPQVHMDDIILSEDEVKYKLLTIKCNKSPGPDQVHPRVVSELKDSLCKPLTQLFNLSLSTGVLPDDWKVSNITVIHKKGSKMDVSNYRPISLTSVICKLFESLIRDKLLEYFSYNNLFSSSQYGFISGRSTMIQLLTVVDKWTAALEDGGQIDVIYTDLEKAFDRVPHVRLLCKLASYGLSPQIITWIKSFLTGRLQRVGLNGVYSEYKPVLSGIPQGSVLGPLLFVIYVNDLPEACLNSLLFMFADDSKLFNIIQNPSDYDLLLNDCQNVFNWCKTWLMNININKCKKLTISSFGRNVIDTTYGFSVLDSNGVSSFMPIDNVSSMSDLGVTVDNNLSFSMHIYDKINKAYRMIGIIKRVFLPVDKNVLLLLYKSLVRSQLEYCNSVFNPYLKTLIRDLEKVQKRATKLVSQCQGKQYKDRLIYLDLPTLKYRRTRGDMIEMFKIVHGIYDKAVCPTLKFCTGVTRGHKFKLEHVYSHLNIRKHSFFIRTIGIWNALPELVVDAPSVNTFKNRLDKFWSKEPFKFDWEADIPGCNL